MTAIEANPKVDFYFSKAKKWQEEMETLRSILLNSGLTEELKWGVPSYMFQQHNVALIHGFKNYCALLFVKGALLQDAQKLLIQQTEHTQAARQLRFTSLQEIAALEPTIKAYLREAIEVEKAGLKVEFKKPAELTIPTEFQQKLDELPALKKAFNALTPGRQRAYLLHFSEPKQAKTREARVERYTPQILNGVGLHDKYSRKG